MSVTCFTLDHVRLMTDRPFAEVTAAFEARLGRHDRGPRKERAAGGDPVGPTAGSETRAERRPAGGGDPSGARRPTPNGERTGRRTGTYSAA